MSDRANTIHFLHIGKTGGTAIKHALSKCDLSHVLVHPHSITLADVPVGEKAFFFLRDPITRYVSGFISRQRQGRPRYSVPWSETEEPAFKTFPTANAMAEALSSRDTQYRDAAIAGMKGVRHVRDSYWHWLKSPQYLLSRSGDILFIGHQEHLANDARVLAAHLKCKRLELPGDDVSAHRNPETADKSLTPLAVENLRQWYREDYTALEICARIARERGFGGSLAGKHDR